MVVFIACNPIFSLLPITLVVYLALVFVSKCHMATCGSAAFTLYHLIENIKTTANANKAIFINSFSRNISLLFTSTSFPKLNA
jgi:hypothetical protein